MGRLWPGNDFSPASCPKPRAGFHACRMQTLGNKFFSPLLREISGSGRSLSTRPDRGSEKMRQKNLPHKRVGEVLVFENSADSFARSLCGTYAGTRSVRVYSADGASGSVVASSVEADTAPASTGSSSSSSVSATATSIPSAWIESIRSRVKSWRWPFFL